MDLTLMAYKPQCCTFFTFLISTDNKKKIKTWCVAAGFDRHGMSRPHKDAETRRTGDVSLWLWPLTVKLVRNVARVVEYPSANFGDTTTIRCRFMGYWRGRASTKCQWAGRDVIAISRSARSKFFFLLRRPKLTNNCFRRQNSRFRQRFSKIGLGYNVAVPH